MSFYNNGRAARGGDYLFHPYGASPAVCTDPAMGSNYFRDVLGMILQDDESLDG